MIIEINKQLEKDFEAYMLKFYNEFKRFSMEDFAAFSSTLLNYYVSNSVIDIHKKQEAAYFLTKLFNKGMGNRITEEHLQIIAQTITADHNVDFTIVNRIFS